MWYVMQTKTGCEEVVKAKIQKILSKGDCGSCKVLYYISKKRYLGEWHEEKEKLLPGYVFLTADNPSGMIEMSGETGDSPAGMGGMSGETEDNPSGMDDGSGGNAETERVLERVKELAGLMRCGRLISPIRKEEEELLKKLAGERDEIGMSYGIIENGILKIKQGVLMGLESSVRKIDRHKRKGYIGLSFEDGEEKLIGIGLEITEKS